MPPRGGEASAPVTTGRDGAPVLVLGALLSSNPISRRVTRVQAGVYALGITLAWAVPVILFVSRVGMVPGLFWVLVVLGVLGWIWVYGSITHRLATEFGCVKCFADHVLWRERGKNPALHRLDTAGFGHIGLDGRTEIVAAHGDLPGHWLRVRVSRFTCEDDLDALENHLIGTDRVGSDPDRVGSDPDRVGSDPDRVGSDPDRVDSDLDRPLTVGQEGEVRTTCAWTWESVFPGRVPLARASLRKPLRAGRLEISVGGETWAMQPPDGRVRCDGDVVFYLGPRWVHAPSGLVLGTVTVTDPEAGTEFRCENGEVLRIQGDTVTLARPGEALLRGACTESGETMECTWTIPVHPVLSALALILRRRGGLEAALETP